MRVVGGTWRGRPLTAPAGRVTRPTSDKVREAMFGILLALPEVTAGPADEAASVASSAGPLAGHHVLDVFAGSGALGIEALSRGAATCTFVERDPAALRSLHANLARLGEPAGAGAVGSSGVSRACVRAGDVRRVLQADARGGARYTLVFADPPYDLYAGVRSALARLLESVVVPGAVLVVETPAGTPAGLPWRVLRERRYGDTLVTVLVADVVSLGEGATADDQACGG